jgi:hypothetical protein
MEFGWVRLAEILLDTEKDPHFGQTLGHTPTNGTGLGMTGNYTHTRPETQRRQIEQALRLWPASLHHAIERGAGAGGSYGPNG